MLVIHSPAGFAAGKNASLFVTREGLYAYEIRVHAASTVNADNSVYLARHTVCSATDNRYDEEPLLVARSFLFTFPFDPLDGTSCAIPTQIHWSLMDIQGAFCVILIIYFQDHVWLLDCQAICNIYIVPIFFQDRSG